MQTADNLVTIYARGTNFNNSPKGWRWKVPSRAAMMTTLPALASSSAMSTTSGKNCP